MSRFGGHFWDEWTLFPGSTESPCTVKLLKDKEPFSFSLFFVGLRLCFRCSSDRLAMSQLPQIQTLVTRQDKALRLGGEVCLTVIGATTVNLHTLWHQTDIGWVSPIWKSDWKHLEQLYITGRSPLGWQLCVLVSKYVTSPAQERKPKEASAGTASALFTGGERLFVRLLALCANGS